jgi:Skp family chaperone for outer membrane proteins
MQLQKDEFMQQEAAIYRRVYKAMETTVADYARTGGIALVIRFNYIEMNDKSDRKTILAAVNRAIVFEDGVDITDEIIKRLNSPVEGGDL